MSLDEISEKLVGLNDKQKALETTSCAVTHTQLVTNEIFVKTLYSTWVPSYKYNGISGHGNVLLIDPVYCVGGNNG